MLEPDLSVLLQAGSALIVGTVSPDGEPRATRGWGLLVTDEERCWLRALVAADDPVTVGNLVVGARVAITAADVRTLQSAQVKGEVRSVEAPTAEDLEVVEQWGERLCEEILDTDGTPPELMRRIKPLEVVAVELAVTDRFDQTPGPTAGSPLGAS